MNKTKEEVDVKKDKSIWIILLVGILVIALVCCIVYIYIMNNAIIENSSVESKQEIVEKNMEIEENVLANNDIVESKTIANKENILSKKEAEKILTEKFKKAAKLFSTGYQSKEFKTKEVDEGNSVEITNFEETLKKYFTNDVIENYKKNAFSIYVKKEKVYFDLMIGSPDYYNLKSVTFKDIKITENEISATANSTYVAAWDSSDTKKYSDTFKLVKKNGKWLVSTYKSHDVSSVK